MSILWYFELIGVIIACWMLIDWLCETYYYLRALFGSKNFDKYGKGTWALVTGCTDGIGLGFVKVLASQGFNLILVSRNPEKLANLEKDLEKYNIKTLSIAKEMSKCTENPSEFFNDIDDKTKNLEVSILVNNIGTAVPGRFHEISKADISTQNALNLWPIVYLSKIFATRMMKRDQPSAIINLSSVTSYVPLAGLIVYSSGKSFDQLFTLNLNEEIRHLVGKNKGKGIDILSLQPGFVNTPATSTLKEKALEISPVDCANSAFKVLGKANYSPGHWKHIIVTIINRTIPISIAAKLFIRSLPKKSQ
jgi:17beta-estradiol 17-dehydrogenase / very-long-chain 3-oxoacyl-CoA reductase